MSDHAVQREATSAESSLPPLGTAARVDALWSLYREALDALRREQERRLEDRSAR